MDDGDGGSFPGENAGQGVVGKADDQIYRTRQEPRPGDFSIADDADELHEAADLLGNAFDLIDERALGRYNEECPQLRRSFAVSQAGKPP